jgi:hypothetical protein
MRRRLAFVSAAVGLLLLLAACGGGDSSAVKFTKQLVKEQSQGQFDKAWDSLHPAQQAVVPKDKYVQCGQQASPTAAQKMDLVSESDAQSNVPEVGTATVHSVKLNVNYGDDTRQPIYNLINVDGKWRWVMRQDAIDSFKGGECPR